MNDKEKAPTLFNRPDVEIVSKPEPVETPTEIITIPSPQGEEALTGELSADFISRIEASIDLYKRLYMAVLRLTNTSDWVNQNGRPYMVGGGAEKVARPFGLIFSNMTRSKQEGKDDKGSYYYWRYESDVSSAKLPGSLHVVGTCSSRDEFFSTYTVEKEGKKVKETRPLSEVDETDIEKSAYTNMIVNGVTRFLGMRNLTWDMLAQAGIKQEDVTSVQYKKKSPTLSQDMVKKRDEVKKHMESFGLAQEDQDKITIALTTNKEKGFEGRKLEDLSEAQMKWIAPRILKMTSEELGKLAGLSHGV